MAFLGEKLGSLLSRPDDGIKDDVPWWMRYGGRSLGTIGGGLTIFMGVWDCVSILVGNVGCLLGGIWQMLAGFAVIGIEAPCCCMFIDLVQNYSNWVERRPYWQRAAFYCGISVVPLFFCFSLTSLFALGLIFATGVIYGMMSIGKKASQEEMRAAAAAQAAAAAASSGNNSGNSSGMKADLVGNVQPISSSQPPTFNPV